MNHTPIFVLWTIVSRTLHTEGKVGFSWDLSKVTDQETDVFIRLLMGKHMFLPFFILFWSAENYVLMVYFLLILLIYDWQTFTMFKICTTSLKIYVRRGHTLLLRLSWNHYVAWAGLQLYQSSSSSLLNTGIRGMSRPTWLCCVVLMSIFMGERLPQQSRLMPIASCSHPCACTGGERNHFSVFVWPNSRHTAQRQLKPSH